jgi:hypothetical protein
MSEPNPVIPIIKTALLEKWILKQLIRKGYSINQIRVRQLTDREDPLFEIMNRYVRGNIKTHLMGKSPTKQKLKMRDEVAFLVNIFVMCSLAMGEENRDILILVYCDY